MSNLSETEQNAIVDMMEKIENLAKELREPMDPRVESCLEMAFRNLAFQLQMDARFDWGPVPEEDDRFLYLDNDKDNIIPDASELEKWLPNDGDEEDG